jgi:hypothetical protein
MHARQRYMFAPAAQKVVYLQRQLRLARLAPRIQVVVIAIPGDGVRFLETKRE